MRYVISLVFTPSQAVCVSENFTLLKAVFAQIVVSVLRKPGRSSQCTIPSKFTVHTLFPGEEVMPLAVDGDSEADGPVTVMWRPSAT